MVAERKKAFEKHGLAFKDAPETVALLAAPPSDATAPRLWRIGLAGEDVAIEEILTSPGVRLEGSDILTLTLLYGLEPGRADALRTHLKLELPIFADAVSASSEAALVHKINFWTMPVQDAMDFAAFCARVEVEMERFLPGNAVCGGPIDMMTLEMAPDPTIRSFPGKTLHHPEQH